MKKSLIIAYISAFLHKVTGFSDQKYDFLELINGSQHCFRKDMKFRVEC